MNAAPRIARGLSLVVVLASGLLGAANASARDVPALIVQPTDRSRSALQAAVSKALQRESVLLSNDALTKSSDLTIEPVRVRDAQGQVIYERNVRVVEHFHLVKSWWRCILVRESTGERFKLAHTKCCAQP